MLVSSVMYAQPGAFDTAPLRASVTTENAFRNNLLDGTLFDRSRRAFSLGWNYAPLETRYGSDAIGVTLIDDNFFGKVTNSAPSTRYSIVDGNHDMFFSIGNGVMTRVDPEIAIGNNGRPVIESATGNTGAVHGFTIVPSEPQTQRFLN
jgi:hypothetical protein